MIMTKKTANLPKYVAVILADDPEGATTIELTGFGRTKISALVKFEEFERLCERFNAKENGLKYYPFVLKTKELLENILQDSEKSKSTLGSDVFELVVGLCECVYGDYSCIKRHNPVKCKKKNITILQKKWPRYSEFWK
jgi:hypothetical protein